MRITSGLAWLAEPVLAVEVLLMAMSLSSVRRFGIRLSGNKWIHSYLFIPLLLRTCKWFSIYLASSHQIPRNCWAQTPFSEHISA
ncbi:hypothetical protein D3C79_958520 [compost metagenome]